jgi:BMFP domain-containing protein YqiC
MSIYTDNLVVKLREQVAALEARLNALEAAAQEKPRRVRTPKQEMLHAEAEQ